MHRTQLTIHRRDGKKRVVSEFKLIERILNLSEAKVWQHAKREWELESVYEEDEPDTCMCGHYPINEICLLRNKENGNSAIVGNVCVKKFLRLPSGPIFAAVKGVKRGSRKSFNAETINLAHRRGWINQWETDFYVDTMRKRKLTEKQSAKRTQVNEKILKMIVNARAK